MAVLRKVSALSRYGNGGGRYMCVQSGGFEGSASRPFGSQIGSSDPEHFAVGIFRIQPQQRQLREGGLDLFAAAADLAQQRTLGRQFLGGSIKNTPDDVEPVGAAVEGDFGFGAAFGRQRRHAFGIDI